MKESREGKKRTVICLHLKDKKIQREESEETAGAQKQKLFPTDTGMVVNDFLQRYFEDILDYSFTAEVEKELDKIEQGEEEWQKMLQRFYKKFHPYVEKSEKVDRKELPTVRLLGTDEASKKNVYLKLGRFGPYVQLGENEDSAESADSNNKPPRARLPKDVMMEEVNITDALQWLSFPKEIGIFEDNAVVIKLGRYGPYIQHKESFHSLSACPLPLHDITLKDAIDIIAESRKKEKERILKSFDENDKVFILKGIYGPYLRFEKKNVRIPKGKDPLSLNYVECEEMARKAPQKGKRYTKKSPSSKKNTK